MDKKTKKDKKLFFVGVHPPNATAINLKHWRVLDKVTTFNKRQKVKMDQSNQEAEKAVAIYKMEAYARSLQKYNGLKEPIIPWNWSLLETRILDVGTMTREQARENYKKVNNRYPKER
jgi:hypothetical protein